MAKKTKTKKNKRMPTAFKPKAKKYSKRDIIALIMALAAICFFILNSIYFLAEKDSLMKMLGEQDVSILAIMPTAFVILALVWVIFAVLMSLVVYKIEHKQMKWSSLLILSIISLFTFRVECCILGIIASILYYKNHR